MFPASLQTRTMVDPPRKILTVKKQMTVLLKIQPAMWNRTIFNRKEGKFFTSFWERFGKKIFISQTN